MGAIGIDAVDEALVVSDCSCKRLASIDWDVVGADRAFAVGLRCALDDWQVLRTAIQDGWAGSRAVGELHRDELYSQINTVVAETAGCKDEEIEEEIVDLLSVYMNNKFNCDLEDGSMEFVAHLVVRLRQDCSSPVGSYAGLKSIVARNQSPPTLMALAEDRTPPSSSPACECMAPIPVRPTIVQDTIEDVTPTVDADGWQTVPTKKNRRRPNQ